MAGQQDEEIVSEPPQPLRFEPRWPVAITIVSVLLLLVSLPARVQVFPTWIQYVIAIIVILPMAAPRLTGVQARWLRIERWTTLLFFLFGGAGTVANLGYLIHVMVYRTNELNGLQMLTSSIAAWVTNVLMFSLLYWQIDRGGPEARANREKRRVDWLFPQEGAPSADVPPDWTPTFVDYLFLGYATATAFSTTDVMPLTSRAKLLMMLESTISLATIVVVVARAINILGS